MKKKYIMIQEDPCSSAFKIGDICYKPLDTDEDGDSYYQRLRDDMSQTINVKYMKLYKQEIKIGGHILTDAPYKDVGKEEAV